MDRSPPSVDEAGTSLVRRSALSILTVVSAAVLVTTVSGCHWFSTAGDRGPQGCAALFATGISPNHGAAAGDTQVTIDGSCSAPATQPTSAPSPHSRQQSIPGTRSPRPARQERDGEGHRVTPGGTRSGGTVWFTYQPSAALDPLPIAPLSSWPGDAGGSSGR